MRQLLTYSRANSVCSERLLGQLEQLKLRRAGMSPGVESAVLPCCPPADLCVVVMSAKFYPKCLTAWTCDTILLNQKVYYLKCILLLYDMNRPIDHFHRDVSVF